MGGWLLAGMVLAGAAVFAGGALAQGTESDAPGVASGGPEFRSGGWTLRPRGRLSIDYVGQEVDGGALGVDASAGGVRLRTLRLGVEGEWNERFRYVAAVAVAGGDVQWQDVFVAFAPTARSTLAVGAFKTVSLENLTSSRVTTFMERGPFNDVLDVGRTINVAAGVHRETWTATAALSGADLNEEGGFGVESGLSARVTFAPVVGDAARIHLGGWARRRDRNDDAAFRYRARPNTNYGRRYIDTGPLGVSDTTLGIEAAVVARSLSVQGEYARLSAEPSMGGGDVELDALYIFASWLPTGETRSYLADTGRFGRIKIGRPVAEGGPGALELVIRYDRTDVGNASRPPLPAAARAGEYAGVTLGVNWHPVGYARLMANYTFGDNDNPGDAFDARVRTLQLRAQFDF